MSIFIDIKNWFTAHKPVLLQIKQVNKKLLLEFQNWENEVAFDDVKLLSKEQLKGYLETEYTRSKELDEKLTKLTASLAIALTVGGLASKAVADNLSASSLKYLVIFLFFLSILYFLIGAKIGFSGLEPKPRYGYGAAYLRLISKKSEKSKRTMLEAVCAFQSMNLIRANEAYAATYHIRQGILCFGLAMTVSLIPEQLLRLDNFKPANWFALTSSVQPVCIATSVKREYLIFPRQPQELFIDRLSSKTYNLEFLLGVEKDDKLLERDHK